LNYVNDDTDLAGTDLFGAYPELRAHLDSLCAGRSWSLTGVSALLHDGASLYLEIIKPAHWRRARGWLLCGLGAIGGSLEPGETVLDCLERELREEVHTRGTVQATTRAVFVYEGEHLTAVQPEPSEHPLPALFTVSRNIHRRHTLPDAEVLAIVTFWAWPVDAPTLGDLYALVRVPLDAVPKVFGACPIAARHLAATPGVVIQARDALPERLVPRPVWTMRSLQRACQAGYFETANGTLWPPGVSRRGD